MTGECFIVTRLTRAPSRHVGKVQIKGFDSAMIQNSGKEEREEREGEETAGGICLKISL